jgi:ABC-type sugar transport system ATPase subunit
MSSIAWPGTLALRLVSITKRFPGVTALDAVDLDLHWGETHALLGENGAGKSTLIKILSGVHTADEGKFLIAGAPVAVTRPSEAQRLGITIVPQDILMVPELSIGRNILLGTEGFAATRGRLSRLDRERVEAALLKVGASFDAEARTGSLSVPHLRLAQIAKSLVSTGSILVLDEPTAVLSEPDAEHLISKVQELRAEGKAILYVSHRLGEVMRIADRFTILRDGKRVGVFRRGEIDRDEIVRLMAKDSKSAPQQASALSRGERQGRPLRVSNLSSARRFRNISIDAQPGQIVGIAGVQGSGHGHFLRAIAGVDEPDEGEIRVGDERLTLGSVRQAVANGLLMVPADRRGAAIVPTLSIRANLALPNNIRRTARRFGLRWPKREKEMAAAYVERLDIRPANPEARIGSLSGGNQQKAAIARALESDAQVLLIEEPTQGVDVGAKAEIHALLRSVSRERDCAVVIATSEFDEIVGLADVVHVMREGRLVASFPGEEATYRRILENALS